MHDSRHSEELAKFLTKNGFEARDANELADAISETNFLNQIALASLSTSKSGSLTSHLLKHDTIDPKLQPDLKQKFFGQISDSALPLNEDQREKAWELVKSGEAGQDIRETIIKLFRQLNTINPDFITKTVTHTADPGRAVGLLKALKEDIKQTGNNFKSSEKDRKLLNNTLKALESEPLGQFVTNSAMIFIDKDNETARLAIIAYARLNGINIDEDNLDQLAVALDRDDPNLYPLLAGVIDTMKDEYGINDFRKGIKLAKDTIEKIR